MEQVDVLVVGAGPAGIAAAVRAAEEGCRVAVVDENLIPADR
jgi:flavin-dependent dehydrogenase